MTKALRMIATVVLIAAIAISGWFVMQIQEKYNAEKDKHHEVSSFKPPPPAVVDADAGEPEDFVNQKILDLKEKYKDAVGWIEIPHTGIDYPFVQVDNNRYYLDRDIDENYSAAGTLFMDCDNDPGFTDFNTVIYGHHMKNETMFGPINRFNDEAFFKTNTKGTIFLADKTFSIDFFAFMIVHTDDTAVYDNPISSVMKRETLDYIQQNARYYRDIGVTQKDSIVTLSTCAYEFKDARMLLVGKITQYQ